MPVPPAGPLGRGLVIPPPASRPEDAAGRALAAAFASYLGVTARAFFRLGESLPEPLREPWRRAALAVQRAYAKSPRPVLGCFASPTVGSAIHAAPLRASLTEFADRIDAALALATPHLLLELALRRLLPDGEPLDWPAAAPLSSLALGATLGPPSRASALRFAPGELRALDGEAVLDALPLHPDAVRERLDPAGTHTDEFTATATYLPVGKVTRFAIVNHNPLAEFEAHPDKAGNAL